ncbi:MAG: ATP-binding protein, partial [Campylobacterales bacterium]|nr:ATP-binding protein [Campylobacterales bacterium]
MQKELLKYLLDFLQNEKIEKTEIFAQLKTTKEEALILRFLTKEYLNGNTEMIIYDILVDDLPKDKENTYEHIEKIELVKNLIHQGWIVLHTFAHMKTSQLSSLEILPLSVSLSGAYLKLLENGNLDLVMPEVKEYTDQLEYLQDQFLRIDLYKNLANIRQNYDATSPNYKRVKNKLSLLEKQIDERLKISDETPKAEEFFQEHKLSDKEQIIFLALLKEEYSSGDESLREQNILIEMVSADDYEKIKNRSVLEDNSTLIEKQIIDYDEILTPFGGISRSFFINEEILNSIIHPTKKEKKSQKIKLDVLVKEQEMFELVEPKTTLDDVILNPKTREMLDTVMRQMDRTVSNRLKEWGIKDKKSGVEAKIIFHGHPGTGKTMTALSMAKSLKKQIISFDCSKILSMYIGESEKNVRKIFDSFKEIAVKSKTDPVLLLNEADQFLSYRTTSANSSADKMHNQMQNIFLEQIEKFDGILVATTNLLETIDPAFSRRFNYKIKFEKPNLEQRKQLWHKMIPQNAQTAEDVSIDELSKYELTGGQINLVVKNTA